MESACNIACNVYGLISKTNFRPCSTHITVREKCLQKLIYERRECWEATDTLFCKFEKNLSQSCEADSDGNLSALSNQLRQEKCAFAQ